ncbi:hypothetical protein GBA65_16115 [Rubrobacter marinus]|uniref:Uncharacterized protein n=1 Tax=Rubrobacter marinus TaxID=2653852 RepID=A0A6G8Q015_9ACTN|nr:hypothetical protein [Rubrobacter marinus]QIN79802.1 hypothetical protein GBA65_16115 [Rubrobacter marinus]
MTGSARDGQATMRDYKERLVKTARMLAMCEKAGVADPMDVAGLAVAAFEDMPLKQAMVFVRSNEGNIRDLAWAFKNSSSAEEFERRVRELKRSPEDGER